MVCRLLLLLLLCFLGLNVPDPWSSLRPFCWEVLHLGWSEMSMDDILKVQVNSTSSSLTLQSVVQIFCFFHPCVWCHFSPLKEKIHLESNIINAEQGMKVTMSGLVDPETIVKKVNRAGTSTSFWAGSPRPPCSTSSWWSLDQLSPTLSPAPTIRPCCSGTHLQINPNVSSILGEKNGSKHKNENKKQNIGTKDCEVEWRRSGAHLDLEDIHLNHLWPPTNAAAPSRKVSRNSTDLAHRGLKNQEEEKKNKTTYHFYRRTPSSSEAASEAICSTPETTWGRGGRSRGVGWSRRGRGGRRRWGW
jgi:hypothetical protein